MTDQNPDPKVPVDPDAVSEEVVLASTPTTPIQLAIDDRELIHEDENTVEETVGQQSTDAARNTRSGRFEPMLAALRLPEKQLAAAYKGSAVHRLLRERFAWYRDIEDNQVLGETLEDTYDAKYGSRLHHFVKSNVLCSLLGLIALALVAQQGVSFAFKDDGAKRHQVAKNNKKPKPRNKAPAAAAPQQTLAEVLQHCIVAPSARVTFDGVSKDVVKAAMFEISRFRTRYKESRLERRYSEALRKSNAIEQVSRQLIAATRGYTAQLEQSLAELERQQNRLRKKLKQTRVGENSGTVATVNQRIQLRNELTQITDAIASGPSRRASDKLAWALKELEQSLTAPAGLAPIPSEQNGLLEAERMNAAQFAAELDRVLSRDVLQPIATHRETSPTIQRYRLQHITDTVERLGLLQDYYRGQPEDLFHQLDREQARVNARLTALIGTATEAAVLDVSGCLQQADQVRAAHHELPTASTPPST